jgi:hypothetical protein
MTKNDEQHQSNGSKGHQADRRTFATAEEARAAGRVVATQQLYRVGTGDGAPVYLWARHAAQAFMVAALSRGWVAAPVDKVPDKATLAAGLAALTPEDRAILIRQFVPAPEQPGGPAPEKPAGTKKGGK